ncbi:MAG: substrate-binding domain-containing protein [Desulfobacter sp.]|nr:MAG: substrate-binding domain-containing protein [Desulfobacter sp.]
MNAVIRIILFAVILVCSQAPALPAGTYDILVIPKNTRYGYWKKVGAGAEAAGREFDLDILFRGPYEEDQIESQLDLIRMGIRKPVDAIVLAPVHGEKMTQTVGRAVERGIKVVVIDSAMSGNFHSSFIASDNYAAGRQAAQYMHSILKAQGRIMMLRLARKNASTESRENGFYNTVNAFGTDLNVVADPYVGVSLGSAYRTILPLLKGDCAIEGIFAPNESSVMAVMKAVQKYSLSDKIKVVGFDFNPEIEAGLRSGQLHGVIVQQPWKMGYLGVKTAFDLLRNTPVPKKIVTKTILVTRKNIDRPEIQGILSPGTP